MLKVYDEDSEYIWCSCPSPEHEDKNPSFCINKIEIGNKPKGFAYCFGCGYVCVYDSDVIEKISNSPGITKPNRRREIIDWKPLTRLYQHRLWERLRNEIWETALTKKWGVSCLDYYEMGWDGRKDYTFPMKNEFDKYIGIQRRTLNGEKSCVFGSRLGLFVPNVELDNVVLLVEGLSDAVVATELGYFGLGQPCSTFGQQQIVNWLKNHNVSNVVMVRDNDIPGERNSKKIKSLCEASSIDIKILTPTPHKDLREYYQKNGKEKTLNFLRG